MAKATFAADDAASCAKLSAVSLPDAAVTSAEYVAAGAWKLPATARIPASAMQQIAKMPAFCRVAATLKPSSDSDIRIEVWLPPSSLWNGRFEAIGNGGFAGSLTYSGMIQALIANYATASTDTGHSGAMDEAVWALGHPEKVVDFGSRAVHELTAKSKAIITSFYGSKAKYAYWNGCSEGGSQALSEAQLFPDDYDGILAGAPANYITRLQTGGNWISQAIHKNPASFIPASKLTLINQAVVAACDLNDGVKDGVIADPRTCHYDFAPLQCKGAEAEDCLTEEQVAGLRKVYDGPKNPRTGDQLFPGLSRGGELDWRAWVVGTDVPPHNLQHRIQDSFFKDFVFQNPNWDWATLDFDKDVATADSKVGPVLNHISPDLHAFKARGGKMVQFHGWYDPAISPINSINYFQSVQSAMGDTKDFYRLFMIPGMYHCAGGPGATEFDRLATVVHWVEDGKIPDQVVAYHQKEGVVDRTRPLCSFPRFAKYKGTGSTDDAANYLCAKE